MIFTGQCFKVRSGRSAGRWVFSGEHIPADINKAELEHLIRLGEVQKVSSPATESVQSVFTEMRNDYSKGSESKGPKVRGTESH